MAFMARFAVAAGTIQLAKGIREEIADLDSSSSVVLDYRLCQKKYFSTTIYLQILSEALNAPPPIT
jgi:hypothetical protein